MQPAAMASQSPGYQSPWLVRQAAACTCTSACGRYVCNILKRAGSLYAPGLYTCVKTVSGSSKPLVVTLLKRRRLLPLALRRVKQSTAVSPSWFVCTLKPQLVLSQPALPPLMIGTFGRLQAGGVSNAAWACLVLSV
jgi:hypothetical protein